MMSSWEQRGVPNPGSPAAVDRGCECPRLDNNNGRGFVVRKDRCFVVTTGCPLHAAIEDTAPL